MLDKTFLCLQAYGFADFYYISAIDGSVYSTKSNKFLSSKRNIYTLQTYDKTTLCISKKKLYRLVYQKDLPIINTIEREEGEVFLPLSNEDQRYLVSNHGRVISLCGYQERLLKPFDNGTNYLHVKINQKNHRVHRLVARLFCQKDSSCPYEQLEVDHIDGNTHNNNAQNLRWCTKQENIQAYWDRVNAQEKEATADV